MRGRSNASQTNKKDFHPFGGKLKKAKKNSLIQEDMKLQRLNRSAGPYSTLDSIPDFTNEVIPEESIQAFSRWLQRPKNKKTLETGLIDHLSAAFRSRIELESSVDSDMQSRYILGNHKLRRSSRNPLNILMEKSRSTTTSKSKLPFSSGPYSRLMNPPLTCRLPKYTVALGMDVFANMVDYEMAIKSRDSMMKKNSTKTNKKDFTPFKKDFTPFGGKVSLTETSFNSDGYD